jgi:hypothetical protein
VNTQNPFQPPSPISSRAPRLDRVVRSAKPLVAVLTSLFCLRAAVNVFYTVTTSRLLGVLHVRSSILSALALIERPLFLTTIVVFCWWMHRSSVNARAAGAEHMKFGPHAWVWFFVPILNVVRPYQAIRELFEVSSHGRGAPGVFGVWWATWLGFQILRWVQAGLTIETIADAATFNDIGMLAHLVDAAAALAAWRVVAAIFEVQEYTRPSVA